MNPSYPPPSDIGGLTDVQRAVLMEIVDEEVVQFHRDLVRIPSINPPGDVREVIAACARPLTVAGFTSEIVHDRPTMPNLIARLGNDDGPELCFNAHVDVVPTGEQSAWTHDPFAADLVDGRIYGRGAGDDKASVTAQVVAGIALAQSGVPLKGRLIVNEVADEEVAGIHGAKFITDAGLISPDYVIVGEQTMNRVALGEKGSGAMYINVRGRTAHGALPWEGMNAIEAIAEIIVALRREHWPVLETRTHPFFHHSSGSVNMIEGGVKANVVPDFARIFIDRRLVPGESPDGVREEIGEIARRAVAGMPGIRIEVEDPGWGGAATLQAEDAPLVQSMIGANQQLGLSTELTGFSMATDGRYFARKGIPAIIYGPGDPRLAHVPDEWVGVDEVIQATRSYALAAVALLT